MKTPIYDGILQTDQDFANFKALNADLSDYAGTGLDWNSSTNQFDSSGGGGGGSGMDENTVTAADIGLVGDGLTDNTAALQAWLDGVTAAKENATLLVPDGLYIFSGALQDTGRRNAQILLPTIAVTDRAVSVTIKGYHPVPYIPWPDLSIPVPQGPIFRSTLATGGGTVPSFIGGMGPVGGVFDLSFLTVRFENMVFQTIQNPLISCLNFENISIVQLNDVLIMAGTAIGENDTVEPTTTTSYGLILPPYNQSMGHQIEVVSISNFYTGAKVGELSHISNINCAVCQYALEFDFSYHVTVIERIVDWHCKNGIKMTNTHPFQVEQYDVERAPAARWFTRVYDVVDPANYASADIAWWTVQGLVGVLDDFDIQGGSGINARRVGGALYIGTDARLVSVTGGAKLEARNPGTGVWVEAARWTNP